MLFDILKSGAEVEVILKTKKKPLTPEIHRNKYELVSNYMHGDADGKTSRKMFFDLDEESVKRMKLFIAAYEACDSGEYLEDQATAFFKSIGMSDDEAEELGSDFGDCFYEGDITCDGNGAGLAGIDLYIWHEDGVKYEVDYKVKK
jgi:hypothetical protein